MSDDHTHSGHRAPGGRESGSGAAPDSGSHPPATTRPPAPAKTDPAADPAAGPVPGPVPPVPAHGRGPRAAAPDSAAATAGSAPGPAAGSVPGGAARTGPGSAARPTPGGPASVLPEQGRARRLPLPPAAATAPVPDAGAGPRDAEVTGRQRLKEGLWPPRVSRAQLIAAVLLFVLGLGLAIQVRSTSSDSGALRGARQEDLVRILDELDNRTQRLDDEKRRLETQRADLENSSNRAEEARRQTEQKTQQLGVLAGTVAAEGPGITLTINDPNGDVQADMLLDTLQELRAAGAEAIQINDVRVVAGTYVSDVSSGVSVDGHRLSRPYRFKVIGSPADLEPALNIPGGVVQTLEKEQATAKVVRSEKIVVDALRPSKQPDYAQSSSQ